MIGTLISIEDSVSSQELNVLANIRDAIILKNYLHHRD